MKRLCIFDFDGTLVDSMESFADTAARIIEDLYNMPFAEARTLYRKTSGIPFFQQLEVIFPNDPRNAEAADLFEEQKLAGYFEQPLFAGTEDLLRHLKERGIKSAISSNNFQNLVTEFVDRKGLKPDITLGYRENFSKGTEHFNYLKQSLSLQPEEMIFVGDSISDSHKAEKAQIDFIGKTGTFDAKEFQDQCPDAVLIAELAEIKNIL